MLQTSSCRNLCENVVIPNTKDTLTCRFCSTRSLLWQIIAVLGQHGGAIISNVASQQEGLNPVWRLPVSVFSCCSGFFPQSDDMYGYQLNWLSCLSLRVNTWDRRLSPCDSCERLQPSRDFELDKQKKRDGFINSCWASEHLVSPPRVETRVFSNSKNLSHSRK